MSTLPATRIELRAVSPRDVWALEQAGVHPLLARLFAARGVKSAAELDDALGGLLPPTSLRGSGDAAKLLADAIAAGRRICIVADYDCDGATACAVMLRGLGVLGAAAATLCYVVPDRRRHGYGLTPAIVDLALAERPDVIVTVDNGIASLDGVAHANAAGVAVVVTDHHLPARVDDVPTLPAAAVIVNPNQPECGFASKHLAGVGVAFYVLLALRAELRARGVFAAATDGRGVDAGGATSGAAGNAVTSPPPQPRLDALLDLVALGTVADVVRLDRNNRCLVAQGLRRVRAGRMQPGVAALFAVAGRDPRRAGAEDFGFAIAPRLNAAGRLADMTLGIECLRTDDAERAAELAAALDAMNRERRGLEVEMRAQAEALVEQAMLLTDGAVEPTLAVFHESFHEGVVGIVAARLKDRLQRPTFVFARGSDGALKGSGRSVDGVHLRDLLDLVSKREPSLLQRFGGHAMAAGCTIGGADFERFRTALAAAAVAAGVPAFGGVRTLPSDGALEAGHFDASTARLLERQVWGAAFSAPLFSETVGVEAQRLVGDKHLKLVVRVGGRPRDAIWFGRREPVGERLHLAYRIAVDAYHGDERAQMIVVHAEPA